MEKNKIPTVRDLDILAEDYVCSLNNDELPIKKENLTEECLKAILSEYKYEFVEEQKNDFINFILSSSDAVYHQIKDRAINDFRESLDEAIGKASELLSEEELLKIMINVANSFCYL